MNKAILCGRLTNTPEVRATANGAMVIRFGLAVNRIHQQEGQPEADFFDVAAWGKTAEAFNRFNIQKGTKLLIEGEIQDNNYTDRQGQKHYGKQIILQRFEFVEPKRITEVEPHEAAANFSQYLNEANEVEEGVLPF